MSWACWGGKRSAQLEKDILANVSHDLRTPLTLIKGYAETVRDITGDDKAKRTEQCSIIVDETDRLSALVNSVMELSKVSSGAEKLNPVDFDMSQLCFEVAGRYDAVCEQNGWTLQLEANKECMVRADPAMMERVLHNLLGNATHHMGADGVFVLRDAVAPDKLVPGLATDGPHVAVDAQMRTNLPGCFACGDLAGKPYQYIKAAGQGNIAALSAVEWLAEQK